jgi:hypothetical protein
VPVRDGSAVDVGGLRATGYAISSSATWTCSVVIDFALPMAAAKSAW